MAFEGLAALGKFLKLVKGGTGWREQDHIPIFRHTGGGQHGLREILFHDNGRLALLIPL